MKDTDIVPGTKVKLFYSKHNINNRTFHIVAIVDEDQVVIKQWMKYNQYWSYDVKPLHWFYLRAGFLKKVR